MKKIQQIILGLIVATGLVATPLVLASSASALDPSNAIQKGVDDAGGDSGSPKLEDAIKNVVNVILYVLGAIAVVMIVIGGIRYTVSGGDSGAVKSAKDTILYAVIGLIVAILAYALVNFVIKAFQ